MKPMAALLLIAGCTILTLTGGALFVRSQSKKFTAMEQGTSESSSSDQPADAVRSFLQQVANQDYTNLYANAQHTDPSMDSESAYDTALAAHFSGIDMTSVLYKPADTSGDIKTYSLSSGTTALGIVKVYNDGSAWQVSMPLTGTKSYLVEVPTGAQLMSNGTAISADKKVQSAVSASGFDGVYNTSIIPQVDIYQLDGLLGAPALTDANGTAYAVVEDVLTGHLLAGTPVQDDAVKNLIITDGETLASYPAKDVGVGAVTAISDTNTLWYQRYVTLQNTWFSDHETSSFSNAQVLDVCQMSDSTMVAHVVFDYYAKNTAESLERTWHIGYQLTFEKSGDSWIICSTAIDNELNPGSVPAE
jgi:hypothetical protein